MAVVRAWVHLADRRLGGTVFASFDRKALELVAATGVESRLLGPAAD